MHQDVEYVEREETMKILILEDDEMVAKVLGYLLEREGIQFDTVNTFDEAMEKISKRYDWIIADYFLNGSETGVDFVTEYKKTNPRTKVLIYTGKMDKINSEDIDKIIYKTVNVDELINFIKTELTPDNYCVNTTCSEKNEIEEIKKTLGDIRDKMSQESNLLALHDKKIAIFETNLENFKVIFQKLEDKVDNVTKSVECVNKSMDEMAKKQASSSVSIVLWVSGIVISSFAAVTTIIYEIVKHALK